MRRHGWIATITLLLGLAAERGHADPITLDQAVARAARRPGVSMAGEDVAAARGLAASARQPTYNPELGAAVGPRFVGGTTGVAVDVSLAQTFELGGKRAARAAVADARTRAAMAGLAVATRDAELATRRTFQLALVARARLDASRQAEELATQMATATRERQELGAGTQLQVNLATAEVGRARHDRVDAENLYEAAIAMLAAAAGAGPDERLEPAGELGALPESPWTRSELVRRALERRPELVQTRSEREAASAEVKLADALARPDLTLGVSYGFEQDTDVNAQTVRVSASIPLPFRNRNQGNRTASRARLRRAQLDEGRQRTAIVREAHLSLQSYARAREGVLGFDREINERLFENLELARQSFESGKIDYFEFNVVRRELIASRTAYLDAVTEAVDAWHALVRAAGEEPTR